MDKHTWWEATMIRDEEELTAAKLEMSPAQPIPADLFSLWSAGTIYRIAVFLQETDARDGLKLA